MKDYCTIDRYYLAPTPKGAFQALIHPCRNPGQHFVFSLLGEKTSPPNTPESVSALLHGGDRRAAMQIMNEVRSAGWIQGFRQARQLPELPFSQTLRELLTTLSSSGQALLADYSGFPIASTGLGASHSQRLATLAAELAVVHNRHADYLVRSLAINEPGWAIIDPLGSSKIGVWVLYPGKHRFVLLINDMPNLNRPEFVTLAWLLVQRYG